MSAEPIAVDDAPGPGTVLGGRYRLLRLLGEGGMGRVFLADDERDGGHVAVKLLADDRPIPKAKERFEREARSIARIDHPNVVRVTDVGEAPRGGLYYVMEHLDGEELATTLAREGPMPWSRVRHIALQLCGALQAVHEAGIVHRDLKLENCFRVTRNGDPDFVKILDFGVVKLLSPEHDEGGGRLTTTGATMGTPAYMAPELCRGKEVDHRVDVYALGVMLYELLAGHVPFGGDSFLDVALKHMNEPPPPLSEHVPPAGLPAGLEAAVTCALAKAREDRFPTMTAFARALERVGEDAEAEPGAGRPIAASGGTEPALPAAAVSLAATLPAAASIREPLPRAAVGAPQPGGTEPSLSRVERIEPEPPRAPARPRVAAWPWLAAGGAAAAGLVAWWWMATGMPSEPYREPERASVVEAAPAERAAVKVDPPVEPGREPPAPPDLDREAEGPRSAPEAPVVDAPAVDPPASDVAPAPAASSGLSARQISTAFRKIQPYVRRCANASTGGRPGERVRAVVVVDRATGRVVSVAASDARHRPAVERCMVGALRRLELPPGGQGTETIKRALFL